MLYFAFKILFSLLETQKLVIFLVLKMGQMNSILLVYIFLVPRHFQCSLCMCVTLFMRYITFQEPKKLVRYRDNKIVSLKGERFTEVKKEEEDDMKKTYVSIKPARQYRFH